MKIAAIVVGCIIGGFLVLMVIGAAVDEGGTIPEKIERECKRAYGDRGEAAITQCRLDMSVRYLRDAERNRSDSTYGRIR
ncbi:hypothetical protein [Methylorubrum populi]|uniref:hypothetical protein n=1 Tax=Methylorubrum populi TaxID=223967 RepID=UPI002353FCDD|nr:hypothetical protein [Methylorubrum populi]